MKTVLMHDGDHDLLSGPVWSLRIRRNLIKAWWLFLFEFLVFPALLTSPTAGCYGDGQHWTHAWAGVSPGRFISGRQHGGVRGLGVRERGQPAQTGGRPGLEEGGSSQVPETLGRPQHPPTSSIQSLGGNNFLLTRGGSFRLLHQEAESVSLWRRRRRRGPSFQVF